ncbi:hypothetical protein IS481_14820 [Caldimonas thermodepolymerans]|nr:hypothetical protein [Caldimonas thermodepolymerans]QPC30995.1 hypothetical protein IS481_14820 [Caldimonas thermodepolymerans]RDH96993.1 hypothetical protein DES46_1098 [Caldimonas thermodepolymerans]
MTRAAASSTLKNATRPSLKASGLPTLAQIQRERHRRSFYEFFKDFWGEIEPEEPYVDSLHIKVLCDHAQAVIEGRIKSLGVEIGPGYAKSLVMAVALPAWVWGPHGRPGYRFGYSTYEYELTVRDSTRTRDLIKSARYQALYGHVFTLTKERENWIQTSAKGFRLATSVGGAATGHRVHLWVYDDLLNAKKARSDAALAEVHEHLRATSTRGVRPSEYARICIGQRLHEDDAGGWVRERGFEVLCLPTEYDPSRHCRTSIGFSDWRTERGEFLFPARFGQKEKEQALRDLLPGGYSAQHQQLPIPAEGGVIKSEYIKVFEREHLPPISHYFVSVDTAQGQDKTNDTTAISVFAVHASGIVLVDGWTGREPAPFVIQRLKDLGQKYNPVAVVIEQKDWGKAMLQLLDGDPGFRWRLVPYVPVVGKNARAEEASPFFFKGYFAVIKSDTLSEQLVAQLVVFPAGKVRDLADSAIQAALYAQLTYTFESRLTASMLDYEGGKRASRTKGSLYSIYDDDD